MTHSDLNQIAKRWLLRAQSAKGPGCKIAFVEVGALGDSERADAWGYRWDWDGGSVLVEVKISRSDFLRDKHKPHRQAGGLGDFRYYMCPEGVITLDDLPERWGLLWVNKRGHVKLMAGHICCLVGSSWGGDRPLVDLWRHDCNKDVERSLLAYLVHRVGDPDALLQEQRGYMRLNSQQATQIIEYEKQDRAYRNEIRSLRMQLKRLD
ncbi:adenylosuccinate synthase [Leclercia adecarboxylata]|uniref:adenylosuccinate synthase n=1 Tax=Leclercia adecarboxylata TaxID=83655 RepID=UPI00111B4FC6|nr:adenylosuccinate synthase [Leclercia adecarboxylata]QCZ30186.1 adenylosuccinate synthase [Leclercia adecarboxylata]